MKWHYIPTLYSRALLKLLLLQSTGRTEEGAWVLVPLSCASNRPSGADRILSTVRQSEGAKRPSGDPSDRENFWKFVYENGVILHAKCHNRVFCLLFVCFLSSLFSFFFLLFPAFFFLFFLSLFFFSPLLLFPLQNHRGGNCPPAPPPPVAPPL